MNCRQLLTIRPFLLLFLLSTCAVAQQKPISLHPRNPHYFIYKDKPEILITSGEHYGAVLNLDFDYVKYLDELHSHALNLTRLFSGAYVEPSGAFNIAQNTLAPFPARFICPWMRSTEPGYSNGGNRFDLSVWDTAYFARLRNFAAEAEKRNIIIEFALFCPFYEDTQWQLSPMNAKNNINRVGDIGRNDVYTLDKNGGLLALQDKLVRKMVSELKNFSNIIYEICNEPYFGGVTIEWQHHIANVIHDTEKDFKNHHLISQNIANGAAKITAPHPDVSIYNFHYASPPVTVGQNYGLGKALGDNETGFRGTSDSTYRREGWQFLFAGGSLYNNLDYSFTVGHENGTFVYPPEQPGGGSLLLRKQLSYLKKFISLFDYIQMQPDSTVITNTLPVTTSAYLLAKKNAEYAVYIFGGKQANLEMKIPNGSYTVEWLNPVTGEYKKDKSIVSKGLITIQTPPYDLDIALRLEKL